ncbi:MAG: hypothetical protein HY459_02530 [Parcubacteria group bacterium]|nr:hypothetical protein [Parcubacteria group bacterium]
MLALDRYALSPTEGNAKLVEVEAANFRLVGDGRINPKYVLEIGDKEAMEFRRRHAPSGSGYESVCTAANAAAMPERLKPALLREIVKEGTDLATRTGEVDSLKRSLLVDIDSFGAVTGMRIGDDAGKMFIVRGPQLVWDAIKYLVDVRGEFLRGLDQRRLQLQESQAGVLNTCSALTLLQRDVLPRYKQALEGFVRHIHIFTGICDYGENCMTDRAQLRPE